MRTFADIVQSIPELLARAGLAASVEAGTLSCVEIIGHSNIVVDVRAGTGRYAIRFDRATRDRGARDAEAEAMARAWRLGVGAEPLWRDDVSGALITRWIENARPLVARDLKNNHGLLAAAARTLGAIHADAGSLDRHLDPRDVLVSVTKADGARSKHPAWLRALLHELRFATERLAAQTALVPSHCDPSPRNFLATDEGLRLIDWEYAAMAPAAWDLGYLAVEADLDPAEASDALIAAYGREVDRTDVNAAMLLAGLQNLLWFAQRSEADPAVKVVDLDRRRTRIEQAAVLIRRRT